MQANNGIIIQNKDHWHELRSKHVGGSEISALFDACSYLTHLELYLIKSGQVSGMIEDNDRMLWGRLLEDAIGQGVSIKKGWDIVNPQRYYVCADTPGMGCTPDRIIHNAGKTTPGLLQIKVVDKFEFMKWDEGQPPLQYQLQLQHEMACVGYVWGALAVLVGGNDLQIFEYDAHTDAIRKIKSAINDFWASIGTGSEPRAVANDYEVVKDLYPLQAGKEVDLSADNELPELCARAMAAAERRKEAEKEEKAAKAEIIRKIGDAERANCSGFFVKYPEIVKNMSAKEAHIQKYRQLTIKEI